MNIAFILIELETVKTIKSYTIIIVTNIQVKYIL